MSCRSVLRYALTIVQAIHAWYEHSWNTCAASGSIKVGMCSSWSAPAESSELNPIGSDLEGAARPQAILARERHRDVLAFWEVRGEDWMPAGLDGLNDGYLALLAQLLDPEILDSARFGRLDCETHLARTGRLSMG